MSNIHTSNKNHVRVYFGFLGLAESLNRGESRRLISIRSARLWERPNLKSTLDLFLELRNKWMTSQIGGYGRRMTEHFENKKSD